MSLMIELKINRSTLRVLGVVFSEILRSSLGRAASEVILFLLRRELGRDPFEVLWENPKTFYRGMEKILGIGAEVLIKLLVSRINSELGLSMSAERFLELVQSSNKSSVEEIRSFLAKISESYQSKSRLCSPYMLQ